MDKQTISKLEEVVSYLHATERKHWEESNKPKEHIYHAVHSLAKWLDDEKNGKHLVKKIFKVLVSYATSGDMFIRAYSADEARIAAMQLLDDGKGEMSNIEQGGANHVEDIMLVEKPEENEIANADVNEEALNEE